MGLIMRLNLSVRFIVSANQQDFEYVSAECSSEGTQQLVVSTWIALFLKWDGSGAVSLPRPRWMANCNGGPEHLTITPEWRWMWKGGKTGGGEACWEMKEGRGDMIHKGCISCPQRSPFLSCRLASPHCLSNVKFNLGCPIFLPVKHCLLRNDQKGEWIVCEI